MKSNQTKEEGKEKEEAPKTPTYAVVVAPTPGTTAATKEDVATLRRIIEESERRSEERMQEMRALIKIMTAAVSRQPNVSKDVKNALPQLQAIIDHLEEANRDGKEARSRLSSFAASTEGMGSKRQASASPLAPSEGAKLAKKKKGGTAAEKPTPEEDVDSCTTIVEVQQALRLKLQEHEGQFDMLRDIGGELIVAGDFNAKALEWGECHPDSRGGRVLDMGFRTGLVILNTGSTSTFRRAGYRETIPDISLALERLAASVRDWRVVKGYRASDHQYITFRVRDVKPARPKARDSRIRWNIRKMDEEALPLALERGQLSLDAIPDGAVTSVQATVVSSMTVQIIHRACEEAIPRTRARGGRRPAY